MKKNNKANWDYMEIILMTADDNDRHHEEWVNSLTDEEFEEHLKKLKNGGFSARKRA